MPQTQAKVTIVLTGGGSGGHITPLLSLAHELKRANERCRVIYVGLKGEKVEGLQSQYKVFDQVCYVPAGKFRRYHGQSYLAHIVDIKTLLLNSRDLFRLIAGIFSSLKLMMRLKPDVVFSKGGFVAVPVGIAAHLKKIPIVTHDSDAMAGLANKIIGRWAVVHATALPAENYAYPKSHTRFTGIPLDPRLAVAKTRPQSYFKAQIDCPQDSLMLLVIGGGLGAKSLNDKFADIYGQLLQANEKLWVVHLSGHKLETELRNEYQTKYQAKQLEKLKLIGFTDELYKYIGAADLVVTRAGATALAEFSLMGKACIVVPSPFLSGGHQLLNAKALESVGAAQVVSNDAPAQELFTIINALLHNSKNRQTLSAEIKKLAKPDAAETLADIIYEVAGHRAGQ